MTQHHTPERRPSTGLSSPFSAAPGEQGRGLARRFAMAGHPVIIGSAAGPGPRHRPGGRAWHLRAGQPRRHPRGGPGDRRGPLRGPQRAAGRPGGRTGRQDRGRLREPARLRPARRVPAAGPRGQRGQQAAALLPGSRVVAAFHHVSAVLLLDPEVETIDLDVLVLGDDRAATDLVQALAARISGCAASTRAACATAARSRP